MSEEYLFIFGCKSTALEIGETAALVNPAWVRRFVVDDKDGCENDAVLTISEFLTLVDTLSGEHRYMISMANHELRANVEAVANQAGLLPATIIHPRAVVSPSATIGEGCYLAPGACVSTQATVGPHCILNLNVTFGHDSRSGAHLIVNPGAAIGGQVTFGERVLVGSNAFVFQGVEIGDDCKIDALTYVARSLEPHSYCTSRQLRVLPRINP